MSVRLLQAREIGVLAAIGRSAGILDETEAEAFMADVQRANRILFEETYGLTAPLTSCQGLPVAAAPSTGEVLSAIHAVHYNTGSISDATRNVLTRMGKAVRTRHAAERTWSA